MNCRELLSTATLIAAFSFVAASCRPPSTEESAPKQIVGEDNRTDVGDAALRSAVGKLAEGDKAFCTAFRIADDKIMTARHCIASRVVEGLRFLTSGEVAFVSKIESSYADADVAILFTSQSRGVALQLADNPRNFKEGQLVGYDLRADRLLSDSTGQMSGAEAPGVINHTFDTIPGSSGAPIINSQGRVIAIHLGADNLTGNPLNYGVWIDSIATAKVPSTLSEQETLEEAAILIAKYLVDKYVGPSLERAIEKFTDWVIDTFKKMISKDTTTPAAKEINGGRSEQLPASGERQLVERPDGRWCAGRLCAESEGRSLNYRERFAYGVTMMVAEIFEKTNGRKPSASELKVLSEQTISGGDTTMVSVVTGYRDGDKYTNHDQSSCNGNDRKVSMSCGGTPGDRFCSAVCVRQVPIREPRSVKSGLSHDQIIAAARGMNNWLNGQFRRAGDRPEIYMSFHDGRSVCRVESQGHLRALGGETKVIVMPAGTNILSGKNYTGGCGWPNGMYRRSNEPEVFRMYDSQFYCHVPTEAALASLGGWSFVTTVDPGSDIGRGRVHKGQCR